MESDYTELPERDLHCEFLNIFKFIWRACEIPAKDEQINAVDVELFDVDHIPSQPIIV